MVYTLSTLQEIVVPVATAKMMALQPHRHLSNIDCMKARTACLVCFINTVNGHHKKRKRSLERSALVAGTLQTLSNLFWTFHIYVQALPKTKTRPWHWHLHCVNIDTRGLSLI